MASLAVDTPPPPSPSQAPPSYDSLSDHGTHVHSVYPYHFTNPLPDASLEPELVHQMSYNDSLYADSGEGLVDNFEVEGGRPDDPPPPYSPGLRYIRAVSGLENVFVTDAPPSYSSIFGQIREAREHSRNNWTFFRRLSEIILNTVGCTILLIVFMSVPLAILVLGAVYVHDCPLEPKIPIFLIIGGISGVLKNVFLIIENVLKRHSQSLSHRLKRHKWIVYVWRAINLIFNLFMLAWIITGSYWIFSLYTTVHSDEFSNCNELLYKFGFSIVISSYILLILMCCCTCICAGVCLRRKKEREEEEGEGEEERGEEGGREERDGSERGSRTPGESEVEIDDESLTRGVGGGEGEDEEETEVDEDDYLSERPYVHNGVTDRHNVDISNELRRSTDQLRETELFASTGAHLPSTRHNHNGVLFLHQYESSPYPSRHQVGGGVCRARSNTDNLNVSDHNIDLSQSRERVVSFNNDRDGDDDDGFETRDRLGHANSTVVIASAPQQQGTCRRSDRPLSLSHIESNSLDSIPAMRACALIRNRVHHSSHSSGLYVTQYSDGFSITAV